MTTIGRPVGSYGATHSAVLGILVREADMDGLVTVTEREIGEELGITKSSVHGHIRNLANDGWLAILPAAAGYLNMNAIQLAESVMA